MNLGEMDLNWVSEDSRTGPKEHFRRLAARVWAHLTWGRWTAIVLFVLAFIAALWLKHNWVEAPVQ